MRSVYQGIKALSTIVRSIFRCLNYLQETLNSVLAGLKTICDRWDSECGLFLHPMGRKLINLWYQPERPFVLFLARLFRHWRGRRLSMSSVPPSAMVIT